MIQMVLPLDPFGAKAPLARAIPTGKFNKKGGMIWRAQTYTHPKYRKWCEDAMPFFVRAAPAEPMTGPLQISLLILTPFLKGEKRKTIHVPRKWCFVKPDYDNVCKAIQDCAEDARWFLNDSQLSRAVIEKVRCAQGESAQIHVVVKALDTPYHLR